MNKINFKSLSLAFIALAIVGLVFTSCSKEEEAAQPQSTNDVKSSAEMDQASTGIEELVVEVFDNNNGTADAARSEVVIVPEPVYCYTVTITQESTPRILTVNFPTEVNDGKGCLIRGHYYKGTLVMSFTYDGIANEVEVTYTLQNDFYFDDKNIVGESVITTVFSNIPNNNPQRTHDVNYTVKWPSGLQATRDGIIYVEWTEGSETLELTDNVFEVTGSWDDTFGNNIYRYNILAALVRKGSCTNNFNFVSGSVNVEHPLFNGVLDFGDGTCDKNATFTFDNDYVVGIILN